MLKWGSIDNPLTFNNGLHTTTHFSYSWVNLIHICMQGVFNPNILIYHPPNSTEGLHFSAFHYYGGRLVSKFILGYGSDFRVWV